MVKWTNIQNFQEQKNMLVSLGYYVYDKSLAKESKIRKCLREKASDLTLIKIITDSEEETVLNLVKI